jgi:hypothetical protein
LYNGEVKNFSQIPEFKYKSEITRKTTNVEKYGFPVVSQNPEIQQKIKTTFQEKYGEEITNASQLDSVKDKKKETCFKNFGVEFPSQDPNIQKVMRENITKTNLEKYGFPVASQNSDVKLKIINSNLETLKERYNVTTPMDIPGVKEKYKNTFQERYGEEITNPFQLDSVKEKRKETYLRNCGYDHPSKSPERKLKTSEQMLDRIFIFKGTSQKRIKNNQLNKFLEDGWSIGHIANLGKNKGRIRILLDGKEKRVFPDQLDEFLENGWNIYSKRHLS